MKEKLNIGNIEVFGFGNEDDLQTLESQINNNNNNSKIKDNIGKQKSPHVKLKKIGRNNLIIKFNAQKKEKDNKSPNDKRRLTIFLNNENNNKLVKKYKKSLNRFKTNNNKENINKTK